MDTDKSFDFLGHVFSRFLVPGLVFVAFALMLPSFLWSHGIQRLSLESVANPGIPEVIVDFLNLLLGITGKPALIIILSICIGILIDLFKVYNYGATRFLRESEDSWFDLKKRIVKAFGIMIAEDKLKNKVTRKNKDDFKEEMEGRIIVLAARIHDVFIEKNYPLIDRRIKNSRTYPEILSMSLISLIWGLYVFAGLIFLMVLMQAIAQFHDLANLWFISLELTYLIVICIIFLANKNILRFGESKVKDEYHKTTRLTAALIEGAFKESKRNEESKIDVSDFFKELKEDKLIEEAPGDEAGGELNGKDIKWRVKVKCRGRAKRRQE